jgi:hypothetical protein
MKSISKTASIGTKLKYILYTAFTGDPVQFPLGEKHYINYMYMYFFIFSDYMQY